MTQESALMQDIIKALYDKGYKVFRINTGSVIDKKTGRRFSTGTPAGHPDLYGYLPGGRIFYIECKVKPNKATEKQQAFIEDARKRGALAGIAYSVKDALRIVEGA